MIRKARFLFLSIALLAAVLLGAGRGSDDKQPFQAGKAAQYSHQTSEKVLVGAKAFDNADLVAEAFGKKTDLLKYGVLPVLVVVENQRDTSIDLRDMEVSLVASDGRHVSAMSPEEISYLGKNGHLAAEGSRRRDSATVAAEEEPIGGARDYGTRVCCPHAAARGFSKWIFLF